MRLTRNTRKVGRRRVGNGMRMILSIGRSRNNGVGNLHRIIRIIGKSGGCICKSGENGRRRKNSYQFSVVSGESGLQSPPTKRKFSHKRFTFSVVSGESGLQSPPTKRKFSHKRFTFSVVSGESGLQSPPTKRKFSTTRDLPFQLSVGNRAYKALPQRESSPTRDLPFRLSVNPPNPPYQGGIRGESGLQSPPTREFRRAEEGNLKLYLTFVRK